MNKMMTDKMQDIKLMDLKIERWFERHFHQVTAGSALHASLLLAKDDVKKIFGIDTSLLEKAAEASTDPLTIKE